MKLKSYLAIATDYIPRPTDCTIDVMAIIPLGNQTTFEEFVNTLFQKLKTEAVTCRGTDTVSNVYVDESIKDAERSNRGTIEAMQFKNLTGGHKNQAVKKISQGINNKVSMILSLRKEWKKAAYRGKLDVKEMFLAYDQECWKVQLKVYAEWIFLFVITKKQTLVFRYLSSMQLNIEIRESIWFLTTYAAVLDSDQTRTRYINISSHWRVRFCCTTRTRRLNWLLYSHCSAGNPVLRI